MLLPLLFPILEEGESGCSFDDLRVRILVAGGDGSDAAAEVVGEERLELALLVPCLLITVQMTI